MQSRDHAPLPGFVPVRHGNQGRAGNGVRAWGDRGVLRNHQSFLNKLYVLQDACLVGVAFLVAWLLRFRTDILPQHHALSFHAYISILTTAVPVFIVTSAFLGLYGTTRTSNLRQVAVQLLKAAVIMALVVMSMLYFTKEVHYSRAVLAALVSLSWLFVLSGRYAVRRIMRVLRAKGFNRKYLLLVGVSESALRFVENLKRHDELGYHVIGFFDQYANQRVDQYAPVRNSEADMAVAAAGATTSGKRRGATTSEGDPVSMNRQGMPMSKTGSVFTSRQGAPVDEAAAVSTSRYGAPASKADSILAPVATQQGTPMAEADSFHMEFLADDPSDARRLSRELREHGLIRLGDLDDLDRALDEYIVDHVVLALPNDSSKVLQRTLATVESHGAHAMLVPDFVDILPSRPRFDEFAGLPIIDTRYAPLDDIVNASVKRAFDIIFALLVLVVLSPVFAMIAFAVKMSSPGPAIYSQERLGKNKRSFRMYKFRTMHHEDEDNGDDRWTVPNDPRRTPVGRILRRMSLDELPQFWNVLKGEMSVIGPRPERPMFVERLRDDIPKYMIKHRVRPGITGWAQVNGLRGDTSIEDRIEYDLRYIEHWTLGWDMRIVLLTCVKGFRNRNAY